MSRRDQRFMVAPLVHVIATEDGGAVVLDLHMDRFLGLDQMGMLLWTLLSNGQTPQEMVHLIAEHYMIESENTLLADIFHFLEQMEHLLLPVQNTGVQHDTGYSQGSWSSFVSVRPHLLSLLSQIVSPFPMSQWLEAWLLLRWVHAFLVQGNLIDITRRFAAMPTNHLVTDEHPDVQRLAKLVQSAAAWQPFNAVCLHQNLTLGFLLRRRRLHVDLVIGVSTFPFFAHAWLRSGTQDLNWKAGLGPGTSQERLHDLSILFCTEWLSGGDRKEESDEWDGSML